MNGPEDDRRLREAFAAQRREDAMQAPAFDRLARAPRRRQAPSRAALAPVLAAAAVVAVVAFLPLESPRRVPGVDEQPIAMPPSPEPTAFLLRMPGGELLSGSPALGRVDPMFDRIGPAHAN